MCNLNTASLEEISGLPGISLARACQASLWAPYASWDELERHLDDGSEAVRYFKGVGAVIGPWGPRVGKHG